MEDVNEDRFPLLKELPEERPEDIPYLTTFVPAMFVPIQRDYTKPPPPQAKEPNARLQQRIDQIDRHAAAVNRNFHYLAQRQAYHLAGRCEQIEREVQERNQLDQTPIYGTDGIEDESTLDLVDLLDQEPDGPPERYSVPASLSSRDLEPQYTHISRDLPRKHYEILTLDMIKLALNNMEGHAGVARVQKEAARAQAASEIARSLGGIGATATPSTPASVSSVGDVRDSHMPGSRVGSEGDSMDTNAD